MSLKTLVRGKNENYDQESQARQLYSLRLAELDRLLGALFDNLSREYGDRCLVVLTADHGLKMPYIPEARASDIPFLTDIRVEIPIFIKGKGVSPQINKAACQPNIDLPKTLLALANLKQDDGLFDGVNLLDNSVPRTASISESFFDGHYELAVRADAHVYFLKFKADDVTCRITDPVPVYEGLFAKGTASYEISYELSRAQPELLQKLKAIANQHIERLEL